ncbi:hypothetical protein [Flavobacterium sp. YO64]|uniref:hypothetical protein n=1 Tax=Flavobacterium sp. YO64 TaxID=394559 RepID=UPI00100AF218|nr:hypothetical protein [Flavobacterium sp. YO64]RXM42762.1 hypothetical protein BOW57_15575 [Flavobacterium sp. YO64]
MKEEDKEYLDLLNKVYFESSTQFDKQLLFVASGALGLSLAFIKDIVVLSKATNKELLLLSWISFGLVILINVISHYTSLKAINYKIENINKKKDRFSQSFNSLTKYFNVMMIVFLASGLVLLIVFIGINI